MHALLLSQHQLRVGRISPEVDHLVHRLLECRRVRRTLQIASVFEHRVMCGRAADSLPFFLHIRIGEPLDVLQRFVAVRRIRHHGDALATQLHTLSFIRRIHEVADLGTTDLGVFVQTREEGKPVHHHRYLAGLECIQTFAHIGVGHTGRRTTFVQGLVELQCANRVRTVHIAVEVIRLGRILVLEAKGIEHVTHTHGDAFRAALGEDVGAIDFLSIDLAALEEFGHLLELCPGFGRSEVTVMLLLELRLDFGFTEPVFAVGPAQRIGHGGQGPVVRRIFRPLGVTDHGCRCKVGHLDAFFGEEVIEFDVVATFRRSADPLAIANDQIAQLAF